MQKNHSSYHKFHRHQITRFLNEGQKILLLIIFLVSSFYCNSQEYNYFHYDTRDGLSGINVYAIVQDKDGFLWFGTETGLSRFDGTHFKNYKTVDGLNDNDIINLFVDSKNRVWIFPFNKTIYYYYQGKIYNSFNDSTIRKFSLKNEIFKACEDKDGNIFFIEPNRLHILSKDNKLRQIDNINDEDYYTNCGISANGYCSILVGSVSDILKNKIVKYEYQDSNFIRINEMPTISVTRNSTEFNRNYSVTRNKDSFEIFIAKNNNKIRFKAPIGFHAVSFVDSNTFAVSTSAKTIFFDIVKKSFTDSFLNFKIVNRCFKDNENNIWFATMYYGLYRLSSPQVRQYIFTHNSNQLSVHSVNFSNKNLYVGTNKNILWHFNSKKNKFEKIEIYLGPEISKISSIQTADQFLILATDYGIFIGNNGVFNKFFPGTGIKNLAVDKGSVIFASDRNVFLFNLNNIYKVDTIWRSRATCAYKLNQECYVGTLGGLYSVKLNNRQSFTSLGELYPFLKNKIVSISSDENKNLWVAVENFGVVCLQNNQVKYSIDKSSGLVSNMCRCLYIDKNNLWLGTDKGISRIDVSSYPFNITNYTAADGLDCEIINCIYAKGDSVFAGTPFGLTFFEASKIQNQSICKIKLTDVKSNRNNWYNNINNIFLKANDNSISFGYAGISFLSDGDITYYYQLKGLDTTWESTKSDSIEFERLPAGDYTFSVYAVNKYGVKSTTISIPFEKEKHFWELWWVQGVAILLIGFSVSVIFRMRIKMVKKLANEKVAHERKIHELEQMALRAQMNPHFIFNSLNSIQQFVFSGNVVEANQFITNFSSLIRQTLYISGKKFITVDEEIKYLKSYLTIEQSKYENIFDFTIETDNVIDTNDAIIPPLILQPYIENSIRHGVLNLKERRGKISIFFLFENDQLVCTVKDNGIGREASSELKRNMKSEHKSKGIELVQKRIESLNAIYNIFISVVIEDITNTSEKGTCVTIKFPLSYGES